MARAGFSNELGRFALAAIIHRLTDACLQSGSAIGMDAIRAGEGGLVTPVGIALALATGMIAGAVNGLLVTRLRITPILATLGTGQIFTGIALVITGGPAIVGFPAAWNWIGNGKLLDDGKRGPMQVKKGDRILFTSYAPETITIEDDEFLLMSESDILAVID